MNVTGSSATVLETLIDEAYLWGLSPEVGANPLLLAAANALVAEVDSPHLRELAGLTEHDDYWVIRETTSRALDELTGRPLPGDIDDFKHFALRAMCRRLLSGDLNTRELTTWAHRHVGHQGPDDLQELVELDDEFEIEILTEGEITARAETEARRLTSS